MTSFTGNLVASWLQQLPPDSAVEVPVGYGQFLVTSLLVLLAVCVLAWVVIRFGLQRLVTGARLAESGPLKVLARIPLEARQTLYVVEVGGKTLLLGSGDRPLAVLSELDGAAVAAALPSRARARSFKQVLARLRSSDAPRAPRAEATAETAAAVGAVGGDGAGCDLSRVRAKVAR